MSRGGRGGGGAGRGGRGGFRDGKLGGRDLPWEHDPEVKPDYTPSELFPPVDQIKPTPLSDKERLQISWFRTFRKRVHDGPLYTVLGNRYRVGKGGAPAAATVDPFEAMPTYTQKYKKKTRTLPRLDTRPYVLDFFPKELRSTLDPDYGKLNGRASSSKKVLKLSKGESVNGLVDDELFQDLDPGQQLPQISDNKDGPNGIKGEEEEDDEGNRAEEDVAEDEEEVDNDFEDDDDMADDYNGEIYFSGGDDVDDDDRGNTEAVYE